MKILVNSLANVSIFEPGFNFPPFRVPGLGFIGEFLSTIACPRKIQHWTGVGEKVSNDGKEEMGFFNQVAAFYLHITQGYDFY